ncbi:DUF420 domain-containing protein [Ekhidna sp.]|uniref:DUF420 domain-containing protein n=1 Tax=Ekhidna sp. TaxID=2608089 RepID=UPI003BA878A9
MVKEQADNKVYLRIIYLISILIPLVVAFLIFFPAKLAIAGDWIKILPGVHAAINSLTVLTLISALVSIKNGNVKLHRSFMFASLILGVFFLISYVLYHSSVESVKFGDINHDGMVSDAELLKVGTSRVIYLVILASHILLSILVVPFVLFAFYYALSDQIERHKKMVKYTYPVWLYVSITGVVVYFMIKPYYF